MKRELRILGLVLLILAAGAVVFMLLHGAPISFYFALPEAEVAAEDAVLVMEPEGGVEVEFLRVLKENVAVRISPAMKGKTTLTLRFPEKAPDWVNTFTVETTPLGTLYDHENGNYSGWQAVILAASLFFLIAAAVMIAGYRRSLREDPFSYATIQKFSLFLFCLSVGLLNSFMLIAYFFDPLIESMSAACMRIARSAGYFMLFSAPILLVFSVMLCLSNLVLIRREGFFPLNLLGILISVVFLIGLFSGRAISHYAMENAGNVLRECLINIYCGFYSLFECMMLSVFLTTTLVTRHRPPYDREYLVILGCKIRQDGTLYPLIRGRVDRALSFADAQTAAGGPDPVFVPSGGKGHDEPVSEGEAMSAYLAERGVSPERIRPETASRNTAENLRFSRDLIEKEKPGAKAAFSTTNYHLFRTGILARKMGWNIDGMGIKTKWYFWPNALVREYIGMLVEGWKGIGLFALGIAAACVATTMFLI